VTLRAVAGHQKAETVEDLTQWLHNLTGCPDVARTHVAACANPSHDDPATWFYVEADRREGVARLRCLSCGLAHPVFDSPLPQQRGRSRDDVRQVVKHTLCRWRRRQDASQQSAVPAADIDNRRVGAEIVPGDYGGLRHL